jgi:uncharacterized protein YhhL (DUF1145 family)
MGGFSGMDRDTIVDCFWDTDSSGSKTSDGGTPKSGVNMRKKTTFSSAGWDFDDTWDIIEGETYPYFIDQYNPPVIQSEVPDAIEDEFYYHMISSEICYLPGCVNKGVYILWYSNSEWFSVGRNGTISGTPSNEDVGIWWAILQVEDVTRNIDRKNFTFEVLNTNDDPVILTEELPDAYEEFPYSIILDGMDIDPTEDRLSWEITNSNVDFLSLDPDTGQLSGMPNQIDVGTYEIEISLDDGIGGITTKVFELNVIDVNDPPVITNEDKVTVFQGESYDETYTSVDQDDIGPFEWYLNTNAEWLSIENSSGRLFGIPEDNDVGIFFVNITVEDPRGGRASRNFSLEVIDINDPPALIDVPDISKIIQGDYYYFEFQAIDIDDPQIFFWILETDATWLSLGSKTGILSGTPGNDHVGIFFVNITVEDQRGERASINFTIEVENLNDPPQWVSGPSDSVIREGEQYSFDVDAIDIDEMDILQYDISSKPMTDISINRMTGEISWIASLNFFTPPYNVLQVTVNVTDGTTVLVHKFSISVIENSTSEPSSSDSDDDFNSSFFLILILTIFGLIIAIVIIFILIRIKTMDKSEEKTVKTLLFGSKKNVMKEIFIRIGA